MTSQQPTTAPGGGTGASHQEVLRALTGILAVFFMAMVTLTIIGTALPVIMAGVRIATVTTIGLVTVTALIGWGGLGQLFIDGFTLNFSTPIVVGIVLSALLAFTADLALVGLQHQLTPWARSGGG